jgi:hypothetical protein
MEAAVVGFIGTVLGALLSLVTGWMNNKHQYRMEGQKLADQQQKERRKQLREKLEEAHQLLSKIRTETTPRASHIMRKTGSTYSREQYQKSNEDVRRLLMITDLYFPQLRDPVENLARLTNRFWNELENIMFLDEAKEPERFRDDVNTAQRELSQASGEIGQKIADAKNILREVAASLSSAVIPAVNASSLASDL